MCGTVTHLSLVLLYMEWASLDLVISTLLIVLGSGLTRELFESSGLSLFALMAGSWYDLLLNMS